MCNELYWFYFLWSSTITANTQYCYSSTITYFKYLMAEWHNTRCTEILVYEHFEIWNIFFLNICLFVCFTGPLFMRILYGWSRTDNNNNLFQLYWWDFFKYRISYIIIIIYIFKSWLMKRLLKSNTAMERFYRNYHLGNSVFWSY